MTILSEKQQAKARRRNRASAPGVVRESPTLEDEISRTPENGGSLEVEATETPERDSEANVVKKVDREQRDGIVKAESILGPPEFVTSVSHGLSSAPPLSLKSVKSNTKLAEAIMVEEEDSKPFAIAKPHDDEPSHNQTRRRYRLYLVLIAVVLIVATVAIVTGIFAGKKKSSKQTPAPEPTASPTSEEEAAFRNVFIGIAGEDIYNSDHPTALAEEWITKNDPMKLSPEAPNLVQRFVLASFYFSASKGAHGAFGNCTRPVGDESAVCPFWEACDPDEYKHDYVEKMRWLSDMHECAWAGITCDPLDDGVVKSISLCRNNLTGPIPPSISSLNSLLAIELGHNSFNSTLPSELGSLHSLLAMNVIGNSLTGTIPDEYWNLVSLLLLDFGMNRLDGTLSSDVGRLTNLRRLYVDKNELVGTFPAGLASLTDLKIMWAEENSFTGTIPTEFGRLSKLEEFWLKGNGFHGTIPTEVGEMQALIDLDLSFNGFQGPIPEEIYGLPLTFLFLNDMNINGTISTSIGRLTHLRQLTLSYNSLSGTIPTELGLCTNLQVAWLHVNELTGSMPSGVCENRGDTPRLQILQSDCFGDPPEVDCQQCCTACCDASNTCDEFEV